MITSQLAKRHKPKICIFSDEIICRKRHGQIDDWCFHLSEDFAISYHYSGVLQGSGAMAFDWCKERGVSVIDFSIGELCFDLCVGLSSRHFCHPHVLRRMKECGSKSCMVVSSANFLDYEISAIGSGLIDYIILFDYSAISGFHEKIYSINPLQKIIISQDLYRIINLEPSDGIHVFFKNNKIDELKQSFFVKSLKKASNMDISSSKIINKDNFRKITVFCFYDIPYFSDLRHAANLAFDNKYYVFMPEALRNSFNKFIYFSSVEDLLKKIDNIDIYDCRESNLPSLKISFLSIIQGL